jgi:hypothetical protein
MSIMDKFNKQLDGVLKGINKEFERRERQPERVWTEKELAEFDAMCDEFEKERQEEEENRNPYEDTSWGAASKWFCIRCGSCLREVAKDDPFHGKACWDAMRRDGTLHYQCTNKNCCHYNAPLTLHHPIGGYKSPAGESYSISWVR